jgi:predicted nuclease of predicted toxin-antitoxin system
MRIHLDESVPHRLRRLLVGHSFSTVQTEGWASTKNGRLPALASSSFDVLLSADKGMGYRQNQRALPMSVLVVRAHSNRLEAMAQLVPAVLAALCGGFEWIDAEWIDAELT